MFSLPPLAAQTAAAPRPLFFTRGRVFLTGPLCVEIVPFTDKSAPCLMLTYFFLFPRPRFSVAETLVCGNRQLSFPCPSGRLCQFASLCAQVSRLCAGFSFSLFVRPCLSDGESLVLSFPKTLLAVCLNGWWFFFFSALTYESCRCFFACSLRTVLGYLLSFAFSRQVQVLASKKFGFSFSSLLWAEVI